MLAVGGAAPLSPRSGHPPARRATDPDGITPITAAHKLKPTSGTPQVALVRAGAKFRNGKLVERPDATTDAAADAAA